MANQYIIKFSNDSDKQPVDGYAELSSTNYGIPILSVRSCEDKNKANILLHQFITASFGQVNFDDDKLEFTLTHLNVINKIIFDKNSSSAYTEFKTQLNTLVNSKFETEYYPSGRVFYVGEVLYVKDDQVTKRVPNGNGILYYDLPNYKIKYSGEFENGKFDGAGILYNKNGNITLKANNISNGIPTQKGKLEVTFKSNKEVVDIEFFDIWDDLGCNDNQSILELVMSNHFLDDLAYCVCEYDDMTYEEINFENKTTDEKITELWDLIKTMQEENKKQYTEIVKITGLTQICVLFLTFMLINKLFNILFSMILEKM